MTEITLMSIILVVCYAGSIYSFLIIPFIVAAMFICFYQNDTFTFMLKVYIENKIWRLENGSN
nr:MAG TPA: hypothetical protein [Caudoviricetes sp.]